MSTFAFLSRTRARDEIHSLIHYQSTTRASYRVDMGFVVNFDDDSSTLVHGVDAYEQEGPLTTFFDRNGGGRLASAFTERVASFRTSRIVEIRRLDAQLVDAQLASTGSHSAGSAAHVCA